MPLQATSGAASYDAFGGGVAAVPNYIEDVFSTYLYTGNDSTQTITNGIDLAGEGGLVWIKPRNAADWHALFDTNRGANLALVSNRTDAQATFANSVTGFTSSGFTLGNSTLTNASAYNLASWTFRKQPKFFDVVTLTADGSGNATFSHNLGATPGCVILKRTNGVSSWYVWHRGLTSTNFSIQLQSTAAQADNGFAWITPSSSTVSINGGYLGPSTQWVAYLFAHDAGGFGLTGTDNVISCGSYTGNNSTNNITLGYEPQFVLIKAASGTYASGTAWLMMDTMRGLPGTVTDAQQLRPNSSAAESSEADSRITATGFQVSGGYNNTNNADNTYIYIAIRRGPMKVPTSGTSVFSPVAYTGNDAQPRTISTDFPVDAAFTSTRQSYNGFITGNRLMGKSLYLETAYTTAQVTDASQYYGFDNNTGMYVGAGSLVNNSAYTYINYALRRAPSFFDEVCYTSTSGYAASFSHNLGVTPELVIFKNRQTGGSSGEWLVYSSGTGNNSNLVLNTTASAVTQSGFIQTLNSTTVVTGAILPQANQNYVSYLFATCAGVSKVGSYTGTGTTKQIDCGFTGGARFVLIKRTDSTGDWYVWDSARGIVSGNDPYLLLNSTAAEVTSTDYIDTYSAGFEISSTAPAAINASGGTYIFLAIA